MRERLARLLNDWKSHQAVITDHRIAQDRLERDMQKVLEVAQKKQIRLKKIEEVPEQKPELSAEHPEPSAELTETPKMVVKKDDRPLPEVPPIITHGQQRSIPQVYVSEVLELINNAPHIVWTAGMLAESLTGIVPVSVVSEILEKLSADHFIYCIGRGRYRAITVAEEGREVN